MLNWMLATSCQQGHLEVVQLLVHSYDADVRDCAIHSNEFAVITGLPLYAAARAGRETHTNRHYEYELMWETQNCSSSSILCVASFPTLLLAKGQCLILEMLNSANTIMSHFMT